MSENKSKKRKTFNLYRTKELDELLPILKQVAEGYDRSVSYMITKSIYHFLVREGKIKPTRKREKKQKVGE
jgi:predicted transcriptional regulator